MQGLTIFGSTNAAKCWTLMAWHSPHSLTWRWGLSLRLFRADEARVWPLFWKHRKYDGLLQWTARIPFVGFLDFHQQRPMWYRDLYHRLRDIEDQRRGMLVLPEGHPDKIQRDKPAAPPPVISDGPSTIN